MVALVESMLSLNEKTALQRQINDTDRQIDQLVYQLYGLTDEEGQLVEGDVPKN